MASRSPHNSLRMRSTRRARPAARRESPAEVLARACHERWEHEGGNAQLKTSLRGPGKVLRSQSPAMAEQEIWGTC